MAFLERAGDVGRVSGTRGRRETGGGRPGTAGHFHDGKIGWPERAWRRSGARASSTAFRLADASGRRNARGTWGMTKGCRGNGDGKEERRRWKESPAPGPFSGHARRQRRQRHHSLPGRDRRNHADVQNSGVLLLFSAPDPLPGRDLPSSKEVRRDGKRLCRPQKDRPKHGACAVFVAVCDCDHIFQTQLPFFSPAAALLPVPAGTRRHTLTISTC